VRWWARTPSPERELIAVSVASWCALAPHLLGSSPGGHGAADLPALLAGAVVTSVAFTVMAAAMVLPPARPAAAYVARASLRSRRGRSVAFFAVAAVGAWLPFSVLAALWHQTVGAVPGIAVAAGAVAVAWWTVAPARRRRLRRCLRTQPIRASGRAADRSSFGYGIAVGHRCLVICGPAMALVVVAGHPAVLVGWMAATAWAERSVDAGERLAPWIAAGWLVIAGVVALLSGG
jgi:predicted metal-binding membrane protein